MPWFSSYLISLMSLVDNGQGHPEPKVLQVSDFFGQLDDLRQEVDSQLEDTSSSGSSAHVVDRENPACQICQQKHVGLNCQKHVDIGVLKCQNACMLPMTRLIIGLSLIRMF